MGNFAINSKQEPIEATVLFSELGCLVGINAIGVDTSFSVRNGELVAKTGHLIAFPSEESKRRVFRLLSEDPEKVLLAEFDEVGPIAEHAIMYAEDRAAA